jgi:protein-disulfide isomerase
MSRSYDARRKARRQQARVTREGATDARRRRPPRAMAVLPVLAIAAILGTVGILGFGGNSGAVDKKEVQQRVSKLLAGIPQQGATLGSPKAPITLWMFADLECSTVKRFATAYLPSIINTWVRDGTVKLEYRSLKTDTSDERTFFRQEVGARAAGKQKKMWDFALTFVYEQDDERVNFATDEFLADIASQVPGLERARWRVDSEERLFEKQVAYQLHAGQQKGLRSTPSFLVAGSPAIREDFETSLSGMVSALAEEASSDVPTLGVLGARQKSLGSVGAR